MGKLGGNGGTHFEGEGPVTAQGAHEGMVQHDGYLTGVRHM